MDIISILSHISQLLLMQFPYHDSEAFEFMRMINYSVSNTGVLRKRKSKTVLLSEVEDLLISCPDALPLSYRRLVGAKAIKLGSWDKNPTYC